MPGNPLELFRKFFGAVRAIFWFVGPFWLLILRSFLFEIWCLKFASEISGRVRIRIRIRSRIAETAVHSVAKG